ncbi:MAG: hypothetical protein COW30_02510 [Rhodospirillales bacterium CG15_BIG_FIL_POST_REV_8_21_14_020_66_15]|nr:MAG: hypothetical protein COW30_02510 [Rhodospirillales bacterium CG15_BIG_FIL_POST_REV_8_21_14_020_66_15]
MTDIMLENRRWTILRLLAGAGGHEFSARIIQKHLGALNRAHAKVSLEQIRKDLRWLDSQLLVEIVIADEEVFAKLIQRGLDAAMGNIKVEGVDEPPLED